MVVFATPDANYTIDDNTVCPDGIVTVEDSSSSSTPLTYSWSSTPAANITTTSSNPATITFTNKVSGSYQMDYVTLDITDDNNCEASHLDSITVHTNPIAEFNITASSCGPDTLTPVNSSQYENTWQWSVSVKNLFMYGFGNPPPV